MAAQLPSPRTASRELGEPEQTDDLRATIVGALKFKGRNTVSVEAGSVYGLTFLMPQLGRSLGWPAEFVSMTISAYGYYILCVILHAALLVFVTKEQHVIDGFSGQMWICDFGVGMDTCQGDSCLGPDGTKLTPARLYDWDSYVTRHFVVDSLKALFPQNVTLIASAIDPGEYGVESWWCRVICVFMFVVSIQEEMNLIFGMLNLLVHVPTSSDNWTSLNEKEEDNPAEGAEYWEQAFDVKVAGMPLAWKIWNCIFIFVPRLWLWWRTGILGTTFLMETSAIDDMIVNSVAMGFLLGIDNVITTNLMSVQANFLLDKAEEYVVDEFAPVHELAPGESPLVKVRNVVFDVLFNKFKPLGTAVLMTAFFVFNYYHHHCDYKDGRWVSKTMHVPESMQFTSWNAFFPSFFPVPEAEEPYWTYAR